MKDVVALMQARLAATREYYNSLPSADLRVRDALEGSINADSFRINLASPPDPGGKPPFPSITALLWRHGIAGEWDAFAPRMDLQACFANALQIVVKDPGRFVYCEGTALSILPTHHAWALDLETGRIVDPTWRAEWIGTRCDAFHYAGIPFALDYALAVHAKAGCVIEGREMDFPLVCGDDDIAQAVHPKFRDRVLGCDTGPAVTASV